MIEVHSAVIEGHRPRRAYTIHLLNSGDAPALVITGRVTARHKRICEQRGHITHVRHTTLGAVAAEAIAKKPEGAWHHVRTVHCMRCPAQLDHTATPLPPTPEPS